MSILSSIMKHLQTKKCACNVQKAIAVVVWRSRVAEASEILFKLYRSYVFCLFWRRSSAVVARASCAASCAACLSSVFMRFPRPLD